MEQKGHEAFTVSPSSAKEASSDDVDGVKEQKEGMEETTYNGVEQRHEISTVPPLATEAASDDMTEEKEEREAVTTEMEETKGLALQRTVTLLGAVSFTIGSMIGTSLLSAGPFCSCLFFFFFLNKKFLFCETAGMLLCSQK